MAEEIVQTTRPAPFIEAAAQPYITDLTKAVGGFKGADLSQVYGPQFIAGLSNLQQQALGSASGLSSYAPYLQTAATQAGQAATQAGLAGQYMGPTAYQQFMSPYQQDVISATLGEYDIQAQKGIRGIADQAIAAGAFGGGREGVQRAEYQAASDRNRAALQAQLLQQGFGQAQQAAGQQFQQQTSLAQLTPGLLGQQVAGLQTLGGTLQAQRQAELSAQQQLAQQQYQQPLQAAQQYGSGVMGLISGYPGSQQVGQVPVPGIAQTAIGAGTTLASIYGALNRNK